MLIYQARVLHTDMPVYNTSRRSNHSIHLPTCSVQRILLMYSPWYTCNKALSILYHSHTWNVTAYILYDQQQRHTHMRTHACTHTHTHTHTPVQPYFTSVCTWTHNFPRYSILTNITTQYPISMSNTTKNVVTRVHEPMHPCPKREKIPEKIQAEVNWAWTVTTSKCDCSQPAIAKHGGMPLSVDTTEMAKSVLNRERYTIHFSI